MRYEKGNLVTGDYPVIVQQVNCKGVMGAGLAKQIRHKYPEVYLDYINMLSFPGTRLGEIVITHTNDRIIIGMFAQDGYGTDKQYTDYDAFKECLEVLAEYMSNYSVKSKYNTVAFPYGIGCGLAGGDWNVIEALIKDFSEKIEQEVIIVRL